MADKNILVEIPEIISILPLRNAVLFPGSIIPIDIGRKKSVKLIEEVVNRDKAIIGIVAQKDPTVEHPQEDDLYKIGTAARILKVLKLSKESYSVIIQGITRFEILGFIGREPYITAKIKTLSFKNIETTDDSKEKIIENHENSDNQSTENTELENDSDANTENVLITENTELENDVEMKALSQNVRILAKKAIKLMPEIPNEAVALIDSVNDYDQLADLISANLDLPIEEKQKILEVIPLKDRFHQILIFLNRQLEILRVREKINHQVQEEMGKSQKEYILRQHLKAIKEELGEISDVDSELEELRNKIEASGMNEEAEEVALKQLNRLKMMSPTSSEYSVTHTYIDWLVELPWQESTEDKLEISEVRKILNEDHYDLEKVKKRIVEYLAVRKLNPDKKGPILCLVGPPGVGKTSLGKSIARALGRTFWRISLGGVRDEAEIRGHRRTYVGALPGRIIQGIKKVGFNNPVFMLDEIDKLGHDFRGDPSSALLEVLDPEQNSTFSDHYLEVQFDLSKIMFIATANVIDTIPAALKDRMEILELPGYTRKEKYEIAKRYIIPRQIKQNGINGENDNYIEFTEDAIYKIIASYTREAGVRNLERQIEAVCRGIAVKVAEGKLKEKIIITPKNLKDYLGTEKYLDILPVEPHEPGVATGLAWTPVGGDVIYIESKKMKGKGNLMLTGQLGDVMKESAQAALSYIKAESENLNINPDFFDSHDIHIHVPAGAIPKDGPSAGITMYSSLLSLILNKRVKHDVAMTGEITLRGKILPVGGIKEKTLAAHSAGVKTLLLPDKNKKDLEDIPPEIKNDMEIKFISNVNQIPKLVFIEE